MLDVTLSLLPFVCEIFVIVKLSELSGSVSLSSITPFEASDTVVVSSSLTEAVSSFAVGASFTAVTSIVIV